MGGPTYLSGFATSAPERLNTVKRSARMPQGRLSGPPHWVKRQNSVEIRSMNTFVASVDFAEIDHEVFRY
jgi:hypothetical protein